MADMTFATAWTQGRHLIDGPEGILEVLVDVPTVFPPRGLAIVAHPQPLLGGSAQHKVPHFLAKSLTEAGWLVVRPNFRGVGGSAGVHDGGNGEANDLLWLTQTLREQLRPRSLSLIGVSFGAYVQAKVAAQLQFQDQIAGHVILAAMPWGEVEGGRRYDTPQAITNALVIHGELDERVPLAAVLEWARVGSQVVSVIPGSDHLFTGKLPTLRKLILDFLSVPGHLIS